MRTEQGRHAARGQCATRTGQGRRAARGRRATRTGQGRRAGRGRHASRTGQGRRRADGTQRVREDRRVVEKKVWFLYSGKQGNKLLREEGKGRKKERSGRQLLLRISIARSASLHIPSSHSASLHIPSSRIPDGAKGRGLAGTCRDSSPPLGLSSHEGSPYRCRPLWVVSVVNVHRFHLDKISLRFPCWVRKPPPLNQILQPSSRPPTVQKLFYLPLFFALNNYR